MNTDFSSLNVLFMKDGNVAYHFDNKQRYYHSLQSSSRPPLLLENASLHILHSYAHKTNFF